MPSTLDVEAIREQIPATSRYAYLNSGWQGPSPQSVITAVQELFRTEAQGQPRPMSTNRVSRPSGAPGRCSPA